MRTPQASLESPRSAYGFVNRRSTVQSRPPAQETAKNEGYHGSSAEVDDLPVFVREYGGAPLETATRSAPEVRDARLDRIANDLVSGRISCDEAMARAKAVAL